MDKQTALSILLVEDQALIALDKARSIEAFGYSVQVVYNGQAAVVAATADPTPDLVIMDIDLGPGMDGTEAAAAILATHDIPILFMSSHTEPEIVSKTEKITSYGYVVKNSSPTVVDASIKMAIKLHRANRTILTERTNLESIMDASPYGVIVIDREYNVIRANPVAELIAGRTLAKGGNVRCGDFLGCIHRRDTGHMCGETAYCSGCTFFSDIERTVREGTPVASREAQFILEREETDRVVWLRYTSTPIILYGAHAAVVTFNENTAEHTAHERVTAVVERSNDGIVAMDVQGRITYANDAYARLSGRAIEELIGDGADEIMQWVHPDDASALRENIERARDAGAQELVYTYRARRPDDTYVLREDRTRLFRSLDGRVEEIWILARNLPENGAHPGQFSVVE